MVAVTETGVIVSYQIYVMMINLICRFCGKTGRIVKYDLAVDAYYEISVAVDKS